MTLTSASLLTPSSLSHLAAWSGHPPTQLPHPLHKTLNLFHTQHPCSDIDDNQPSHVTKMTKNMMTWVVQ